MYKHVSTGDKGQSVVRGVYDESYIYAANKPYI